MSRHPNDCPCTRCTTRRLETIHALRAEVQRLKVEREKLDEWWGRESVKAAKALVVSETAGLQIELASARARVDAILGTQTSEPLIGVLTRLAEGADHLLSDHDCDALGHEGLRYAEQAARRYVDIIKTPEPEEQP